MSNSNFLKTSIESKLKIKDLRELENFNHGLKVQPLFTNVNMSRKDSTSDLTSVDGEKKKKKQKGGILVQKITNFSKIMSSSKGRDKICGIIQYTAKLLYTLQVYSNLEDVKKLVKDTKIVNAFYSKKIYNSMSQGRKIFKF